QIFGAKFGERERLKRAVDGGENDESAWLQKRRTAAEKAVAVRHMLQNFHCNDGVERQSFVREVFGARETIGGRHIRLARVGRCGGNVLAGSVDAEHVEALPRQRFREQAAAAADV